MDFFTDLAPYVAPGEVVAVDVDDVLTGSVDLDEFTSLVVADDPLPGFSEPIAEGPAQPGFTREPPAEAALTAPCAYSEGTQPLLPPTCYAAYEFDVDPQYNNQQVTVSIDSPESVENDWDLYLERQSRITGEWFRVGASTTPSGDESINILTPPVGHYRALIVNWAGTVPPSKFEVAFSNVYAGPPVEPSRRTLAERDAWGAKLKAFVEDGGNLVLTDGGIKNVAYTGLLPRTVVNNFTVYAGFIGFTRDGQGDTYGDPLAENVNQPGAAEGPGHRHQTYEPVPIGYSIQNANGGDFNGSPVWAVDQVEWEKAGGRTAGLTTADQVTLGELKVGDGVVRVVGAALPMPTEQYYHPFGLANYALTYTGYQVLENVLAWVRSRPDLTLAPSDIAVSDTRNTATITATVHNVGTKAAQNVGVRFEVDGSQVGTVQTIASIAAGGSGTASVAWDIRGKNGEHTVTVTADPAGAIIELDETNNSASRTVLVRGNLVQNGSFEASSSGTSPDNWSSSGETSYGGSDGDKSVTAGLGGVWVSDEIEVDAGKTYGLVAAVEGAGTVAVQQLSATGAVLSTVTSDLVTIAAGVTHVRISLAGGLGGATFDDVVFWQE
jgi:hypothetical protein